MAKDYGLVTESEEPLKALVRQMGKVDGGTDLNSRIRAGFPFLGQFIGHDITSDSGLSVEPKDDQGPSFNSRTPALDLDCLYGLGPLRDPQLYDPKQQGKFKLDEKREFDLPRSQRGTALIADPRNDRNLILAQLHLAFLKFHNAVFERVDEIKDSISSYQWRFERTQRLVQWHYQWIILREFLPLLVGPRMVFDILTGNSLWYKWGQGLFIPLEFSVAAYRSGHSQIHYRYRISDEIRLPLFSAKNSPGQRQDLQGGPIDETHRVDWKYFFDTEAGLKPDLNRASKTIKPRLAGTLLFPPPDVIDDRKQTQNPEPDSLARKALALRDLERGYKRGLPSGQAVAAMMEAAGAPVAVRGGLKKKFENELKSLPSELREFQEATPLWYYILKEAEVQYKGEMLGDVGGRIVAEVIIGLLQADSSSLWGKVDLAYLCEILQGAPELQYRSDSTPETGDRREKRSEILGWRPERLIAPNEDFTIVDLLKFAGVETK